MSIQERVRLDALSRVKRGELTVVAAASLMDDWFEGRAGKCVLMVMGSPMIS